MFVNLWQERLVQLEWTVDMVELEKKDGRESREIKVPESIYNDKKYWNIWNICKKSLFFTKNVFLEKVVFTYVRLDYIADEINIETTI